MATEGEKDITPYWRTLKSRGELNEKYPGGVEAQATRLESEGHTIDRRRKTPRVADYEKALVEV
jgi:alkylated DNA nucleotide flippase Atl1